MNTRNVIHESLQTAIKSGITSYGAISLQVISLMWLRTTLNYQYKHGTTFKQTLGILYNQGKIPRFYRGIIPAFFQAPLSRFGDVAINTGVMFYLNNTNNTRDLSILSKTFIGSFFAGLWRINLMPIDTTKTIMQVHGKKGLLILREKIKTNGFHVLYNGGISAYSATLIGHFPWFLTFNTLELYIPQPNKNNKYKTILSICRLGLIGFSSSFISDICSNSFRIIKISKQTKKKDITYKKIITKIIEKDGIQGLLFTGLKTKIITNGIQGILFIILWKTIENKI